MKKIEDHTDAEIIEALGAERIYRILGSLRGKKQTPHAGPGRPLKRTPCPTCGKTQKSAAAAKAHCAGK